jgi:hypothetical protein
VTREDWRERFERFAEGLGGQAVYVTIDLDCLTADEAVTNWENGLFAAADLAWGLQVLRRRCRIVAGDACGAFSPPRMARWTQRLASWWDHPRTVRVDAIEAQRRNLRAIEAIFAP